MQEFFINKDASMPLLKMELINDGKTDFNHFYEMVQSGATITFTMTNCETGAIKISNKMAILVEKENNKDEEYYICYKWDTNGRDTKTKGKFSGKFTINFHSDNRKLIVPIQDELIIYIQ